MPHYKSSLTIKLYLGRIDPWMLNTEYGDGAGLPAEIQSAASAANQIPGCIRFRVFIYTRLLACLA